MPHTGIGNLLEHTTKCVLRPDSSVHISCVVVMIFSFQTSYNPTTSTCKHIINIQFFKKGPISIA